MGTHPIFESDFDCLTDNKQNMSSRNEKMERSQASGIVRDSISGASFIPATQRADGSMRKTRRVKEGYVPPEDIGKFVCSAERAYRQKAHYVVGTSQARDPNARGPSESIFASYDPKASQTQEVSKAAKKNAKRKAAKARKAAETRVDPENEVIEDISSVVAGLNQVKLKQEAEKSESKSEEDALSELAALSPEEKQKNIKKRNKLLRQIEELESRKEKGEKLDSDQTKKLNRKDQVLKELEILNA